MIKIIWEGQRVIYIYDQDYSVLISQSHTKGYYLFMMGIPSSAYLSGVPAQLRETITLSEHRQTGFLVLLYRCIPESVFHILKSTYHNIIPNPESIYEIRYNFTPKNRL